MPVRVWNHRFCCLCGSRLPSDPYRLRDAPVCYPDRGAQGAVRQQSAEQIRGSFPDPRVSADGHPACARDVVPETVFHRSCGGLPGRIASRSDNAERKRSVWAENRHCPVLFWPSAFPLSFRLPPKATRFWLLAVWVCVELLFRLLPVPVLKNRPFPHFLCQSRPSCCLCQPSHNRLRLLCFPQSSRPLLLLPTQVSPLLQSLSLPSLHSSRHLPPEQASPVPSFLPPQASLP